MVFHSAFISSIMSRDRFLRVFYSLNLAHNALEPGHVTVPFQFNEMELYVQFPFI